MEKHKINKDKLLQILLNLSALNLGGLNLPVKLDTEVKIGDLIDVEVEVGGDNKKKHHDCCDPCKKHDPCWDPCDPCKHHDHKKWDGHDHEKCECKGKLQHSIFGFNILADICPWCETKKSEVFSSFNVPGLTSFLFKSTKVFKPSCHKVFTPGGFAIIGTSLNVSGLGRITVGTDTFNAAFSLSLFESLGFGNPDSYAFTISFIDGAGNPSAVVATIGGVDDQNLFIRKCHNDHCGCHGHHHGFGGFDEFDNDFSTGFGGFPTPVTGVAATAIPTGTRTITYTANGVTNTLDLNTLGNA